MNILINGCSFLSNGHYKTHFKELVNADVVNLAKAGSCNRRIIRTTVDYIEQHPTVNLVILGLTFFDRQEIPILKYPKKEEGRWVSYNSRGLQGSFINRNDKLITGTYDQVDDYIQQRYRFDINEFYLDQLYTDLRLLIGYLNSREIGLCILNMCDKHHKKVSFGKSVMPLDFIANEFMETSGCRSPDEDKQLPFNARHHFEDDVLILVEYILKYIRENDIARI